MPEKNAMGKPCSSMATTKALRMLPSVTLAGEQLQRHSTLRICCQSIAAAIVISLTILLKIGCLAEHAMLVWATEVGLTKEAAIVHAVRGVKLDANHWVGSKGNLPHKLHSTRVALP